MSVLLLVESNTTGTGRKFARRAVALGVESVLICADPDRYPYAVQDGVRQVVADTADEAAVLAAARELGRRSEIAGVTSSSEYYVPCAAATAAAMSLSGPDVDAVRVCRDKAAQRAVLAAAGVGIPGYVVVGDVSEMTRTGLPFPVVVKPVQGSGSVGVRWCADMTDAAARVAELLASPANERGLTGPAKVLVEEYVTGPEYSVEVFAGRPIVVVAKRTGPLPWFVEIGHDLPATLPVETERHIMECATAAVRAVRMTWGAVHVELRLGRDGPRIIEVNPRPAGGRIPDLVRAALGMDLIDAQVRAALGDIADVEWHGVTDFASIRFLTAPRRAVVADPELAVTAALDVAGVIDAALARTRNECLEPAVDFRGRAGHVVAVAGDAHSAAGAAERGLELLGRALHPVRTVEAR